MRDHLYVIGIGGTGMRCLEAFVHTCAMGMYDNTTVNILAIDTDLENGNFNRLKELVEDSYQKVKGINKNHYALEDTFFSAKINFHKFCPDYSKPDKNGKFSVISKYIYENKHEQELANLLLTENVREFDLKHGYRAQTHLGSMLMYHGILEEVKQNPHGQVAKYIQSIFDASETGKARVFVLGSVFGGTGASSIPVIPKAFNEAVNIMIPGKSLSKVFFGAVLLSSYFKFPAPDENQRQNQKVIASAKNFAMNSQVAMMFYNDDHTVKTTYQKFYMLGTPSNDFETKQSTNDTLTGGSSQKNDCHYIELLCATAAYDFFNTPIHKLEEIKNEKREVQHYYRTLNPNGKLQFKDFFSTDKLQEFAKKLGLFTAMSFLIYPDFTDFAAAAQTGTLSRNNISGYEDIEPAEVVALKKYLRLFHFGLSTKDNIISGWLRQVHRSTGGSDKFLLHADLFGFTNYKELKKFKFNKNLFRPDDPDLEQKDFSTGIFGTPYDEFKDEFVKRNDDPSISHKIEKLIKRTYKTLESLYKF